MMKTRFLNLLLMGSIVITAIVLNACKKDETVPTNEIKNGTVTDIDGNVYKTVIIGNQEWMAEDLRVTHYPNGDPIPHITNEDDWKELSDNNTDDAYCFYNNNSSTDYGALYTYAAAIGDDWNRDKTIKQGVCPDGWHLPGNHDWNELTTYLGGLSVAGGEMKETGTTHWDSPNNGATNSSGFTALPVGDRNSVSGVFANSGQSCIWWSAIQYDEENAYYTAVFYRNATALHSFHFKSWGKPVRCIKD